MTVTAPHPPVVTDEDTHVLFREARHRRRRRFVMLGCLLAAAGLAGGLTASFAGSPPRQPGTAHREGRSNPPAGIVGHVILRGDGIGLAHFGQAEAGAVADLDDLLGSPLHAKPTDMAGNCTIDAAMQWPTITAYFFQGRFVGYGTNSPNGHFFNSNAGTVEGLRIGDSLARATLLYGTSLKTSTAQGGSWSVATSTGTLAGLWSNEINRTSPEPRIADITAGSVGCPGASP
jgi:hypothetical protein